MVVYDGEMPSEIHLSDYQKTLVRRNGAITSLVDGKLCKITRRDLNHLENGHLPPATEIFHAW